MYSRGVKPATPQKFVLTEAVAESSVATPKARRDIHTAAIEAGYRPLQASPQRRHSNIPRIGDSVDALRNWLDTLSHVPFGAEVLIQVPVHYSPVFFTKALTWAKRRRRLRVTMVVHDIDSWRFAVSAREQRAENHVIHLADHLIVHNPRMAVALRSLIPSHTSIHSLDMFDYRAHPRESGPAPQCLAQLTRIAIAGNLHPQVAGYVTRLGELTSRDSVSFILYGPNYQIDAGLKGVHHAGILNPERLVEDLVADWGLVWQGGELETCSGAVGEYTRMNNPHKASLYLAAGLPAHHS